MQLLSETDIFNDVVKRNQQFFDYTSPIAIQAWIEFTGITRNISKLYQTIADFLKSIHSLNELNRVIPLNFKSMFIVFVSILVLVSVLVLFRFRLCVSTLSSRYLSHHF